MPYEAGCRNGVSRNFAGVDYGRPTHGPSSPWITERNVTVLGRPSIAAPHVLGGLTEVAEHAAHILGEAFQTEAIPAATFTESPVCPSRETQDAFT